MAAFASWAVPPEERTKMIATAAATPPTPTSHAQSGTLESGLEACFVSRRWGAWGVRGGLGGRGFLSATKNRIRTVADASLAEEPGLGRSLVRVPRMRGRPERLARPVDRRLELRGEGLRRGHRRTSARRHHRLAHDDRDPRQA